MKIKNGKIVIITKTIVLETLLERAVFNAAMKDAKSQMVESMTDFQESVKISLDDITGKENLYPKGLEVIRIVNKLLYVEEN